MIFIYNLKSDLISQVRLRDDYYSYVSNSLYFYVFNTILATPNDKRVREALTLAIDRKRLTDTLLQDGSIPIRHVTPNFENYDYEKELILFDNEKAKELLKEADYPNGERFPNLNIKYNINEANKKIAEFIQNQ